MRCGTGMLATVILWRQSEDRHLAEGCLKRDAGVVLVGGCSSRMGTSKALLPYKGGLLHQHMSGMLREAGLGHVYLSGEVPGAEAIPDRHPHAGPAQAIANLLEKFSGTYDRLLVVPVDMPLLTASVLTHLLQQPGSSHFIRHPLPVCLRTGKVEGEVRSVRDLIAACAALPLDLPEAWKPAMQNFNTPEEWAGVCGS